MLRRDIHGALQRLLDATAALFAADVVTEELRATAASAWREYQHGLEAFILELGAPDEASAAALAPLAAPRRLTSPRGARTAEGDAVMYSVDGHAVTASVTMRWAHGLYYSVVVIDPPDGPRHAHFSRGFVRQWDANHYAERYLRSRYDGAAIARVPVVAGATPG